MLEDFWNELTKLALDKNLSEQPLQWLGQKRAGNKPVYVHELLLLSAHLCGGLCIVGAEAKEDEMSATLVQIDASDVLEKSGVELGSEVELESSVKNKPEVELETDTQVDNSWQIDFENLLKSV